MIIRCRLTYNETTQKYSMVNFEHDLTKTKSYFVLQIHYLADGLYYRLVEQQGSEINHPILAKLDFFSLVSGKIPNTWALSKKDKGYAVLGPEKWSNPNNWKKDFWEAYFDGNAEAIKCYKEELEMIKEADKGF